MKTVLIGTAADVTTAATPQAVASGSLAAFSLQSDGTLTLLTSGTGTSAFTDAAYSKLHGADFLIVQGVPSGNTLRKAFIRNGGGMSKNSELNLPTPTGRKYVAPVPSVYNIGYDGATAAYDMISGAVGTYGLNVKNTTAGAPAFPTTNGSTYFSTASAATSIAISNAMASQINTSTLAATMGEWKFAFAEVLSGATTGAPTSTPTATVTNGSNVVTLSTTSVDLVNGAYIKIGAAATKTYAIYQIASGGTTATLTLTTPYVNPSIAIGASITGLTTGFASAATIVAGVTGVRVTECYNIFNGSNVLEPLTNKIISVACTANLYGTPTQNNGSVAKSYTAAAGTVSSAVATQGVGTYPQVYKEELWAAGEIGFTNRIWFPEAFPLYTVSTSTYDCWTLKLSDIFDDMTAQSFRRGSYSELFIALPTATYAVFSSILANI